jgi:hypothetical protein
MFCLFYTEYSKEIPTKTRNGTSITMEQNLYYITKDDSTSLTNQPYDKISFDDITTHLPQDIQAN